MRSVRVVYARFTGRLPAPPLHAGGGDGGDGLAESRIDKPAAGSHDCGGCCSRANVKRTPPPPPDGIAAPLGRTSNCCTRLIAQYSNIASQQRIGQVAKRDMRPSAVMQLLQPVCIMQFSSSTWP